MTIAKYLDAEARRHGVPIKIEKLIFLRASAPLRFNRAFQND